ncbi:hypothetical protein [Streptomyces aureocirculatus]|uniref:hypothetical protein n=1 Tax=Streptomyces aureocirculatus TaxID=67275 RepID=UPI000A89F870|nr:hypothetical protein [Streptomyces aureocirculatus]
MTTPTSTPPITTPVVLDLQATSEELLERARDDFRIFHDAWAQRDLEDRVHGQAAIRP